MIEHTQYFLVAWMEIQKNDPYLMILFPCSLTGLAMEWFYHLPPDITSFNELFNKFVNHFSYNIENYIIIPNLYKIKKIQGESFASYLQRWRHKDSRCKCLIPDKQLFDIFISNVQVDISYQLAMLFPNEFEETI